MDAFRALLAASIIMLARNRVLIITSLGLALISVLVFGFLFGGNGTSRLSLGVVDQDQSAVSAQIVAQLRGSPSLRVTSGSETAEVQALRDGHLDAVIIIAPGFASELAQGRASLQVYYDQSNPVTLASARMAVQSIVDGINQGLTHQPSPLTLDERAVSVHSLREIDWLTPGQLGQLLLWANLSVGVALVAWRNQGILRRLAATPLPPGALLAAQVLARLVISIGQAAIVLAVSILVFHVQVIGSWAALTLALTLGALTMLALGFAIGSFARTQDAAQAIVFTISFPMLFLGGSYFPTDGAPAFLVPVIKAMPLTYLNDALRQIINNGASLATVQTDLLVLAAWLVAGLLLAVRAFRWS
jgi:ABC-2 type transport system permease protein